MGLCSEAVREFNFSVFNFYGEKINKMKKFFNELYCIYKGCNEIVDGYPIIRDWNNPAICWVTDPLMNRAGFWDKSHPNYKIRIDSILKNAEKMRGLVKNK